jgi:hypothetical protein
VTKKDEKRPVTDVLGIGRAVEALSDPVALLILFGGIFALVYGRCW